MAEAASEGGKGLYESLKAFAGTLLAITHTRLQLLSTDLEEERERLLSLLLFGLEALFCLGIGVVLATVFIVLAFWDSHRLLVLGTLAGLYLLAGMVASGVVLYKARTRPRLFATSLSEFSKDREQLSSRP
jgi:uncharacterized membrane protein YqjE